MAPHIALRPATQDPCEGEGEGEGEGERDVDVDAPDAGWRNARVRRSAAGDGDGEHDGEGDGKDCRAASSAWGEERVKGARDSSPKGGEGVDARLECASGPDERPIDSLSRVRRACVREVFRAAVVDGTGMGGDGAREEGIGNA